MDLNINIVIMRGYWDAVCEHCGREKDRYPSLRFRGTAGLDCGGCDLCDGKEDMGTVCEDCYKFLTGGL